ncbi:MAG: hypothetical protein ACFFKA_01145 [Candidatus Thorarchaeota archaeon]
MKIKKDILIVFIITSSLFFSLRVDFLQQKFSDNDNIEYNSLEKVKSSDIAGSDLYAENIDVYVAGNSSIIKQSMLSNDTSIIPQFDTRDPAFYKCNVLISTSNRILPDPFPRILEEIGYSSQYEMSFNEFSGFLYYDRELSAISVATRAQRALEIIKRKFEMDLVMLNITDTHFFPFVGYYPDWKIYLEEITANLPKDGYWKALDLDRLSSSNYNNHHHLSSTVFIINDLKILEDNFLESIDQVNFNLNSLDLSFLEDLDVQTIFEQFSDVIVDYSSLFGNFSSIIQGNTTISQEGIGNFTDAFNSFILSNESHYVSLMIQYEGLANAITPISATTRRFNLWKSLNYQGEPLRPSEKVFIALTGAFMSNINIKIFSTNILEATPNNFMLYDFLLEQIGLILFYADIEFDVESLRDISFKPIWVDEGGFKRSYVIPINLEDPTNYINFLHLLGLQGFPGIPSGLFNSIDNIIVTYEILNSEPNLIIKKELINNNSSLGVFQDFSFNITATNLGNTTAWGIPTPIPINLEDTFTFIVGPVGSILGLDDDLMDAIWEIVRVEYPNQYTNLEDFFKFDEDPRIFYFDTSGIGLIDTYYPNVLNFTNLLPYNENMEYIIQQIEIGNQALISALNTIGVTSQDLIDTFTNTYSIWNADNWRLEPNEFISYEFSNFSISDSDSFTSFYRYNFTLNENYPQLPSLISGISINNTNPSMALNLDDDEWQIESEQKYTGLEMLEIQFLFENDSYIDFYNKSIDNVSIIINFNDSEDLVNIEIFNFSTETFNNISNYLISNVNDTYTYSFVKNQESLDWLFNPETQNNHTIIIRLIATSSNKFNISINDFDIQFAYRDINEYKVQSSRVIFSTASGLIEYTRFSNSVSLSTIDMASIISFSNVSHFISEAGNINEFSLTIKNIGTSNASKINISAQLPGILYDNQDFILLENNLRYTKDILKPSEQITINFTFYTHNTIRISKVNITYFNDYYIKNINSSILESNPNDLCIIAPIDYNLTFPFIKVIDIYYNSSNIAPSIGETFNISVGIKNRSSYDINISNLSFTMNDYFGNIQRIDNNTLIINNLEYSTFRVLNITLYKHSWKGYFYPSINFINNNENKLIQIGHSDSLVLGIINFSIVKTIDKDQVEIGDIITIQLTVINTGTICSGNVDLSDFISFNQLEFSLVSGSLINKIDCLSPGQNISYFYRIKAINQNLIMLKPASIEHYYLTRTTVISNEILIKVVLPISIRNLFLLIPSIVSLLVILLFLWQSHKYKAKKYETERYESYLLKSTSTDSILSFKRTLNEEIKAMEPKQENILKEEVSIHE